MADGIRGIMKSVKSQDNKAFGEGIQMTTDSVCDLIQEASQAAYLVGVAHPKSEPGRIGYVDRGLFERCQRDLQNACREITSPHVTERQVRLPLLLSTQLPCFLM